MASNLRRSKRTVGKRVNELNRRVTRLQKRPAPKRIADRVIATNNIAQNTVTSVELAPGAVDTAALDSSVSSAISTAQSTADGKNKIFYQTSAPTAVSTGDLWFDTDNEFALARWNGSSWVSFGLGNAAISNLDAGKLTAGTISVTGVGAVNAINAGTPVGSLYPFSVDSSGVIRAISGTIGAFTLSSTALTASSLSTGFASESATISLATSGEIDLRLDFDNGLGTAWYVDTLINKAGDEGGINVEGNSSGSLQSTRIRSSFVESRNFTGEEFLHGSTAISRYTSSDTYTRVGTGSTTVGAFRVENSVNVYDQVISSGRDVFINSNGTLGYNSASSARYKDEVSTLNVDYKDVLKIEPVTFYYKPGVAADLTYENRELEVGVIAEQVEEIGSLSILLDYDNDVVSGFKYNRLAVYLLEVCRKQEEQIEDLKARLDALEGN